MIESYHPICCLTGKTHQVIHRQKYVFFTVTQVTVVESHRRRISGVQGRFDLVIRSRGCCGQLGRVHSADIKIVGVPRFDAYLQTPPNTEIYVHYLRIIYLEYSEYLGTSLERKELWMLRIFIHFELSPSRDLCDRLFYSLSSELVFKICH